MNPDFAFFVIIMVGSVGAIIGGIVSNKTASLTGQVAALVAFSGVMTAIGGIIGQLSTSLVTFLKMWIENKRAERLEKLDRKELIDHIENNQMMIRDLSTLLNEYRDRIESQKSRLDEQHKFIESFYQWKARPLPDEGSIKTSLNADHVDPGEKLKPESEP